jgi:hypothetical protein
MVGVVWGILRMKIQPHLREKPAGRKCACDHGGNAKYRGKFMGGEFLGRPIDNLGRGDAFLNDIADYECYSSIDDDGV